MRKMDVYVFLRSEVQLVQFQSQEHIVILMLLLILMFGVVVGGVRGRYGEARTGSVSCHTVDASMCPFARRFVQCSLVRMR